MKPAQPDLFAYRPPPPDRYPYSPGYKENTTSRDAARAMKAHAPTLRMMVLDEIARAPGTPDEIAARINKSFISVRPRVTELYNLELVEPTGERRKNASGLSAQVMRRTATPIPEGGV